MNVTANLKSLGLTPAPALPAAATWRAWYQGRDKGFHNYTIYNGSTTVARTRESMRMAKKVSEDWANLLLNEAVEIEVTSAYEGDTTNEIFKAILARNNFYERANQLVELTMALGTGAFVEYIDAEGEVAIDFIRQDMIYPLAWDNGDITEAAFASYRINDGKAQTYINVHTLDNYGDYIISNHLFDDKGKEIALPGNIEPEVYTFSPRPRFQIIKPNIVNADDLDSPFGASVYAAAIPRLKACDLAFDSLQNEFNLGRKRIIVPISMARIMMSETDETPKPIFDPADVAFYAMRVRDAEQQKPVDLTGPLRIEEHVSGIQAALNYLADGCGLGSGRYEYTQAGGVKTATEVISEQSDLYQNIKKHELILRPALVRMIEAIADMIDLDPDELEISVHFDDSIIQDSDAIAKKALLEYQAGLIDAVEYFQTTRGLTEEQATQLAEKIQARKPPEPTLDWRDPFYTDS